ncbi:hypothetical protein ACFL54_04225 [Planctomycetota bacterium]
MKGNVYVYFELVKTYRDPSDKKIVRSKFLKHLGKDRDGIQEKLNEFKLEMKGHFTAERLLKILNRQLKE